MTSGIAQLLGRFERDDGGLLAAQAAAFAFVAACDGEVSPHESGRFVEFALEEGGESPFELARDFDALTEGLLADLQGGRPLVLQTIARVRQNPSHVAKVGRAARMSAAADVDMADAEEVAMAEIAEALGVDPGKL
jgi:tellurite resistance protein